MAEAEAQPLLQNLEEPWLSFGHVVFQGVGLRYLPDGPWALQGVDLDIQPGQTVGVVGRTGEHSIPLLVTVFLSLRQAVFKDSGHETTTFASWVI